MTNLDPSIFNHVNMLSTWNSGGGIELDIIELKDGLILAISEESVVLYRDMDDLVSGDTQERKTIFL